MSVFQSVITGLIIIAIMIILDLGTKLMSGLNAANNGFKFEWNKFLLFLRQGVAPYFGIWILYSLANILIIWLSENLAIIELPGFAENTMAGIIYAAWSAIAVRLGVSIIDNLKQLGIKKPEVEAYTVNPISDEKPDDSNLGKTEDIQDGSVDGS